jgi:uncharacterized protein
MLQRVVFDCNVFVQSAARPRGPSAACFELAERREVELCVSRDVLDEVQDVLLRPRVRARFPVLTPRLIAEFLVRLRRTSTLIESVEPVLQYPRDRDDEPYLNLAAAAQATWLVSRDNDLLALASDKSEFAQALRASYPSLQIVDPVQFLAQVRRPSA